MAWNDEEWEKFFEEVRMPDAQPGYIGRQLFLNDNLRIPFYSAWLERRRARREGKQ